MNAKCAVEYDPILYSPIDPEAGDAVCEEPDAARNLADIQARFAEVPLPWDLEQAINEFEVVFGVGPAGSMRELGNVTITDEGKMSGPPVVMKELAQNLLYSRSSGVSYLEHATTEQAARFYAWQAYYRSVMDVTTEKAIESSWLLALTLRDLFDKKDHSSLNFGHDGNMDGIAAYYGLEWEAPPFLGGKLLPTPPTSAIRFVYDDEADTVSASFIYLPFDKEPSAAGFLESPIKAWSRADFMQATTEALARFGAEECFSRSPYGNTASTVVV